MTEHELLEIEKRCNAATSEPRVINPPQQMEDEYGNIIKKYCSYPGGIEDKKTMQEERKVIITLTETEDGEITLSLNSDFIFDVDSVKNFEQTVMAMIGQAAVRNECLVVKCIPKQ